MSIEWRALPSYSRYEAGSNGEVRRIVDGGTPATSPRILRASGRPGDYREVAVTNDLGISGNQRRARIVALAFHGPPPSAKHQIDHLNAVKDDDRPENLEWVTPQENIRRAWSRNPEAKRQAASAAGKKGGAKTGLRIRYDLEFQRRFVAARNARRALK